MKLSLRYFFTACIVVLLSTGMIGAVLVNLLMSTLWDSRREQLHTSQLYAADSFSSFVSLTPGNLTEAQIEKICRQIPLPSDTGIAVAAADHAAVEKDTERFRREDGRLILESSCCTDTGDGYYIVSVYTDVTDIRKTGEQLWRIYGIAVLLLTGIGGAILYWLTDRIAAPLNTLRRAAQDIVSGHYGKTVEICTSAAEIADLTAGFNTMSAAVDQTIRAMQDEAQRREMFAAGFAHELKTPVTAIIGYAELMEGYELTQEEQLQAVRTIRQEGKRLEDLSARMLEMFLYRQEETPMTAIPLARLSERLTATLTPLSEKYGVPFAIRFGDDSVTANETLLLSMLYNLADNAFKATADGKPVLIFADAVEETVRLGVRDEGRGISPESIPHLTEPFYREDKNRSRALGGAGLGLSLSGEIARLHGTELVFDSTPGVGTLVTFELKKGDDPDAQP